MRTLVTFSVRRRVTIFMVALAVIAFGFVGYGRLTLDLLPDIAYPSLTVQTEFADTAPAEVENLVTRPVEEAVGVLRGLQSVHSVSRGGMSEVTLEFDWDSEMDVLSMDVREKLDRLTLPEGTDSPIVLRFDPSLDPIMRLAVSGPGDLAELRRIIERRVKPELETLRGVAAATIRGGVEEEIQVEVDQDRLAALSIPIGMVRSMVSSANVNAPGGSLEDVSNQYLIRTVNEFRTVQEIADLVITRRGDAPIRLGDVAEVRRGARDREEITRYNGVECVELAIYKEGDANSVTVARGVHQRLPDAEAILPPGHTISVLFDQSRFIEQAITEVRVALGVGGLLAILVLFVFLRDVRSTLIIATSIPLSVIATFIVMYRADVSLNIMSLGGLTLGIGMLVDNSIVVLESIYRRRKDGLSLASAAVTGTTEVGGAVLASTLTTVAVFLPIVFVEGIAGQLFRDMALTVTFSLLASLVVALTLIPMLSALGEPLGPATNLDAAADRPVSTTGGRMTLGAISRGYDRLLRGALRHRFPTLVAAAALLAVSLVGLRSAGTELIPTISEGEFYFEVTLPEGTPLQVTDGTMAAMEGMVEARSGALAHYYSTVGSRLVAGGLSLNTRAENLGQINLVMAERDNEAVEAELAAALREEFATIPELTTREGKPTYFSLRTPVEVILFGEDLDALRSTSLDLARRLDALEGLTDIRSSLEEGSPELQIIFDRDRLAVLGLDVRTLSATLRDRVQGVVATTFKEAERQIDIRVRNREADRATASDVRNLVVPGPDGNPIRLLTVAEVIESRGPAEIHRIQQQRAAVITANLEGVSLGSAVQGIESLLADYPLPPEVSVELGGQNEEMQVSFASLRFAMALAVFLVYLVMAAVFESIVHPLIVLFTIPLALVGVSAGILASGTIISVIVLIGAVMLVGIVVNNAIVLIDTINQLRRAGMDKLDAVIHGGQIRLRPILMTTLTTVLGLLPMSLGIGEGAELRAPLAVTVSWGLAFSTLLTLVVIPAAYMLVPSRIRPDEPTGEIVDPR